MAQGRVSDKSAELVLEIAAEFGINGTDAECYVGIEQRLLLVAKNDVDTGASNHHLGNAGRGPAAMECGLLVEIQIQPNAKIAKKFGHPGFQIRCAAIAPIAIVQAERSPVRSS